MRLVILTLALVLCVSGACFAAGSLLLDDFEGAISGGAEGTVDFGAGNGSAVDVTANTEIKISGAQSLKINYNAVFGGYIYVARGFNLDAKKADWLLKPEDIDWKKYRGISFYVYGTASKTNIALDIKDEGGEFWRFIFEDNFQGWKQIICPFDEFFVRTDWQPDDADKNDTLELPIMSFQFEPRPEARGTLYVDQVELVAK
jgi:hypothetical protein